MYINIDCAHVHIQPKSCIYIYTYTNIIYYRFGGLVKKEKKVCICTYIYIYYTHTSVQSSGMTQASFGFTSISCNDASSTFRALSALASTSRSVSSSEHPEFNLLRISIFFSGISERAWRTALFQSSVHKRMAFLTNTICTSSPRLMRSTTISSTTDSSSDGMETSILVAIRIWGPLTAESPRTCLRVLGTSFIFLAILGAFEQMAVH